VRRELGAEGQDLRLVVGGTKDHHRDRGQTADCRGQLTFQRTRYYHSTRTHDLGSAMASQHAGRAYQGYAATIPSHTRCTAYRAAASRNRPAHNDQTRHGETIDNRSIIIYQYILQPLQGGVAGVVDSFLQYELPNATSWKATVHHRTTGKASRVYGSTTAHHAALLNQTLLYSTLPSSVTAQVQHQHHQIQSIRP
jgi:hypothetical protein